MLLKHVNVYHVNLNDYLILFVGLKNGLTE